MSETVRCRHCGERIVRAETPTGARWLHVAHGGWYCHRTVAGLEGPCPTCEVGPSRETTGLVCQDCGKDYGKDYGVSGNPPDCEGHREQQHRDRQPPWCSRCGWTHGQPAKPARKLGKSIAERDAESQGHQPWTPEGGYVPVQPYSGGEPE